MEQASPKICVVYAKNAVIAILQEAKILQEEDIQALESSIIPLIDQTGRINLVINFCNVKFLTSSALGLLIRINKKVYESQGQLKLCAINPNILEIFRITRLDEIFDICDNQDEAVQSFS